LTVGQRDKLGSHFETETTFPAGWMRRNGSW